MESNPISQFLAKPSMKPSQLPYVNNSKKIYSNLYKMTLTKPLKVYQYPFHLDPPIASEDVLMRETLFKYANRELKEIYGDCFQTGDLLYSFKKVTDVKTVKILHRRTNIEYTMIIQPNSQEICPNASLIDSDPLGKQCLELMLRNILQCNPNLAFYRNLMVNISQHRIVQSDKTKIQFFPGFTTSFMLTANGTFLNVTLKNKILSTETILEIMAQMNYKTKQGQDKIKKYLIDRSFKTKYSNRNYTIEDISFDKTPHNATINKDGHTLNLMNYYKVAHSIDIQNKDQPLLIVTRMGSQDQKVTLYFVPELCYLCGLDDSAIRDRNFMQSLAEFTKLKPDERVRNTNNFISLLGETKRIVISDKKKKETIVEQPSSKERKDYFGFDIQPAKNQFDGYYMTPVCLVSGKQTIHLNNKTFTIAKAVTMNKWLCFYDKKNYNDADYLSKSLIQASKGFKLVIQEPEWVEMTSYYADDWTATVDDYMKEGTYQFVLFVIDRNDALYSPLKIHSLVKKGYISQVVKTGSLKKNALSVCSKILLQLNAKLGGYSYTVDFETKVKQMNLMVVGVDSSHVSGKRTGVALVASVNKDLTQFFNKEIILNEETKIQLHFSVQKFLVEAIQTYFELNKQLPGGVIIYRQGVSNGQKQYLQNEVGKIYQFLSGQSLDQLLKGTKIPFYYILVNTKTTLKFFEIAGQSYSNPEPGLVIMDGVTNPDHFEFYIQPQNVTGGSATPTCYHVAYGTMNFPEFLPKFTFDLCHLYANWQGPVRIPHVLKAAEKLSKMTAKNTKGELNQKLALTQAYL